jgi:hypothetical protein
MPRASGSAKIDPLMAAFNGSANGQKPFVGEPSATRILGLVSLITANERGCQMLVSNRTADISRVSRVVWRGS